MTVEKRTKEMMGHCDVAVEARDGDEYDDGNGWMCFFLFFCVFVLTAFGYMAGVSGFVKQGQDDCVDMC